MRSTHSAQDDRRWGELGDLPLLAFVLAEILDDERLHASDAEQALAGGVDGEASEVAGDPAAIELFGDGGGGAAAYEAIQHQTIRAGGGLDDPP